MFMVIFLASQYVFAQLNWNEAKKLIELSRNGDTVAVKKLKHAAQSGDSLGQVAYGLLLFNGDGIKKNEGEAVKWMRSAAQKGSLNAFTNLAQAYEMGVGGLPKSPVIAVALYSYASAHGAKSAKELAESLATVMKPDDISKVSALIQKLTDSKNPLDVIDSFIVESESIETSNTAKTLSPIWSDPNTNLTWTVCTYGSVLITLGSDSQIICSSIEEDGGKSTYLRWFDAIAEAKQASFAGHNDWRIPTLNEILTIFKCENPEWRTNRANSTQWLDHVKTELGYHCPHSTGGSLQPIPPILSLGSIWTSSSAIQHGIVSDFDLLKEDVILANPRIYMDLRAGPTWGNSDTKNQFILVRGGNPTEEWYAAMTDAKKIAKDIAEKDAVSKIALAKYHEERKIKKAEEEKYYAEKRRRYEEETIKLRSSDIKPGDIILQGLVIEVKGDLVNVQIHNGSITKWIRRADLLPVKQYKSFAR